MHKVYTQYESAVCVVQTRVSAHMVSTTGTTAPCYLVWGPLGSGVGVFCSICTCVPRPSLCSNVIEKCITHASRQERALLVEEVCSCQDE